MFQVEKTHPIPKSGGHTGAPRKYPIYEMAVGDSFFVSGQGSQGTAASAARIYARKSGKHFTARTVDNGVRIWRVS